MKIIKHGNYSAIERYKCNNCGCVFELDTSTNDTRTYGTHDTYDRWIPVCPECDASFCIEKIEVKDDGKDVITGWYPRLEVKEKDSKELRKAIKEETKILKGIEIDNEVQIHN